MAHDEEQFRALALEGKRPAAIAKRLPRTEEAIRSRAQKLGISFKRSPPDYHLVELGLKAKGK
jgi:hypothetical protein